jgi:acyl-CoA thioesterase FadM
MTSVIGRPRYEGSNICTWIGFKHVMYLIEEAVLAHLRGEGSVPRWLYERDGLGVEIADSDTRIATALHMDDEVRTEVVAHKHDALTFRTASYVDSLRVATATVRVELVPAGDVGTPRVSVPPAQAGAAMVAGRGFQGVDPLIAPVVGDSNAFVWRWRIPYFYCHFSERLQHNGYLRLMEEVVDLFLAARGISIRDMLAGQRWIPVVPHAQLRILQPALMEEEIYTVLTVEDIFKDLLYTARMDCYVPRDGELAHTATGRITHGYAEVVDRGTWRHVPFDGKTLGALRGN